MTTLHVIIVVVGLITLIFLSAGIYFYKLAIYRQKKEFLKNNPDLTQGNLGNTDETWGSGKEWLGKQTCKNINIVSFDGLNLYGNYISASYPTTNTVILVHGYTGRGTDMSSFTRYYNEDLCFNVLIPDCRGHGESEGNYIGFGWHDRLDILRWIDYLIDYSNEEIDEEIKKRSGKAKSAIHKSKDETKIIIHGVSMGAATALMTSGEKLPASVKCIISDCAYTSAKDILSYQMQRMFKLPKFPLIQITSLICKLKSGYFFGEASAINQVQKCKIPILFIHGNDDKFVPTAMVNELYEAANCEKQLLIVDKAGHGNAFRTDMEGYKKQLECFLERYIL